MEVLRDIIDKITHSFENRRNESGGILGGKKNIITEFCFDRECTKYEYIPDIINVNKIIEEWNKQDIDFMGFVHSHKDNCNLSYADIEYARKIISVNNVKYIHMFLYVNKNNEIIDYIVNMYDVIKTNINLV